MADRIALLDLDATLADYDAAIQRDLSLIASPYDREHFAEQLDLAYNAEVPYIKNRIKLIRSQPGWWASLAPLKAGFAVVELLKKYDFLLHILTKAPSSVDAAWSEKVQWCKTHMPGTDIAITPNKGMVYGKILFDDHPEHVIPWLKHRPRGMVIMPDRRWNKDIGHPQVVRYTDDNLGEIEERIKKLIQAEE